MSDENRQEFNFQKQSILIIVNISNSKYTTRNDTILHMVLLLFYSILLYYFIDIFNITNVRPQNKNKNKNKNKLDRETKKANSCIIKEKQNKHTNKNYLVVPAELLCQPLVSCFG